MESFVHKKEEEEKRASRINSSYSMMSAINQLGYTYIYENATPMYSDNIDGNHNKHQGLR